MTPLNCSGPVKPKAATSAPPARATATRTPSGRGLVTGSKRGSSVVTVTTCTIASASVAAATAVVESFRRMLSTYAKAGTAQNAAAMAAVGDGATDAAA